MTKPNTRDKSSRMRPYDRALPINMLRAREAMMQRFRPMLHARSLTDQQWRIIRALAEFGPCEILDLSRTCVIHPASLSRILPRMEQAGHLARRPNDADKRRVIVTLTSAGQKIFDSVAPESEATYASIERDIGHDRIQELYELLDHIVAVLDKPEHQPDA